MTSDLAPPARPPEPARDPTELGIARAAALFERLEPEQAAATLEPVLAADPHSAQAWMLMARIRLASTRRRRRWTRRTRRSSWPRRTRGRWPPRSRALTLLGRHEEAVTMAYRAVIVEPENPLWHDRVAWALLAADRHLADAEQAARTAIGLDPNEAHYYFTHGVALDALGHTDQARQALLISLRLEPENPVAQHRLAVLDSHANRAAQAKRRGWKLFGRKDDDQH